MEAPLEDIISHVCAVETSCISLSPSELLNHTPFPGLCLFWTQESRFFINFYRGYHAFETRIGLRYGHIVAYRELRCDFFWLVYKILSLYYVIYK